MIEGMYTAAAGMAAQQRATEALANDIANLSTPGYKAVKVRFRDLLEERGAPGVTSGAGATADVSGRAWTQGTLYDTERPLDLAIDGPGFFTVRRADGGAALTRNGSFQLDGRGRLATSDGDLVLPGVTVPRGTDVTQLRIDAEGTARLGGTVVGRADVVDVPVRDALRAAGGGLFEAGAASGDPRPATGARVQQARLEASNASVLQLVGGQRTFQFLARVIKVQDEVLATANRIRP